MATICGTFVRRRGGRSVAARADSPSVTCAWPPKARILASSASRYSSLNPPGRGLSMVSAAPIDSAVSVCSAPSWVSDETTRICASAARWRILGSASIPPMPGISRSSRITSTSVVLSASSAFSAVSASATTQRSSSLAIMRENTVRTVSESSTIITRTLSA